jgi:hypothetical protein
MNHMAKNVILLAMLAFLVSCATTKQYGATGGSRADGTVKLSYQYGGFEKPVVDPQQALSLARSKCRAWGYTDAEAFGTEISTCTASNAYGCLQYVVTAEYQCLGGPGK